MTGNVVTCAHVTGSDSEVTSFDRKSPGSCCTRPEVKCWVCLSSNRAVTRKRSLSHDRK